MKTKDSQSADSQSADTHVGSHVRLEEMEKEKELSEGLYEEIDNLNTPFTMEYNMSYSTVTNAV